MIDVSKYIQQLEDLREVLFRKIDGLWLDLNMVGGNLSIEEIMRLYYETGVLWLNKTGYSTI